ncbi:hypothetical protein C8Q80DRAFT_1272873 [Daedaleopsis nitida]|nr:hypothetical protein C8Q80DRAFT_1272873 [Daedaleopsis nitida]
MSQPSSPVQQTASIGPQSSTAPAPALGTTPASALKAEDTQDNAASNQANVAAKPRDWPVPHIMLYVKKLEESGEPSCDILGKAIGREAVAGFLEYVYRTFVWVPPELYSSYAKRNFEKSGFMETCSVYGTFHRTYGDDDVGPVPILGLGWADIIQNVVRLDVVYTKA